LAELPLFKSFSSTQLKKLIEQSQLRIYTPREVIINFGQPGRFLGIIIDGEAEAVITEEMGERRRLGLLKRGDFLGEMSLLTGEPTSADVVALEKCQILLIPQEVFSISLAINPDAMKVMARTLTERLRSRQQDDKAQARVEHAWQSVPDPYGLQLSTAKPAKILVINCGSSSLKYSYFDTAQMSNNLEGIVERIGFENSCIISSSKGGQDAQRIRCCWLQ
jgi:acetate kinase